MRKATFRSFGCSSKSRVRIRANGTVRLPPKLDVPWDWAEAAAAAIILGEAQNTNSPTMDGFCATDAQGAFVVREVLRFWE